MSSAVGDGCNAISKKTCSTKEQLLSHHQLQWDFTQGAAYYSLMQIVISMQCLLFSLEMYFLWNVNLCIYFFKGRASHKGNGTELHSISCSPRKTTYKATYSDVCLFFFLLCVVLTRWRGFREFDEPKSLWYEKSPTPYSQWKRVWCGKKL